MWQKRVESTPTELDRILTESSTRNMELEQTIADMEEKSALSEAKWQGEIKIRDETIAALQKELQESKAREDECREECDSLREDVTGLSAAYSSLEEEYRRCQQEAASSTTAFDAATASTPPGEGREETDNRTASVHQQQEGEASEQISSASVSSTTAAAATAGSTEVATLRAENNRLRNDARAAEEWMVMAVERLGDMNTQNMTLQQQIQAMEGEMEQLRSSDTQDDEAAEQRWAEERDHRAHAEQEIARLSAQLHASLQEERGRRAEVEVMAAQAREAAARTLAEERDRRAQVEAALAQAHDQMQSIYDQMNTERDDARARMAQLEERLAQAPASAEPLIRAETEILALRNTIDSLTEQVAAAQADVERTRQSEQEEIYRRESLIRELESKLGDGLGSYTVEDIHIRDEELKQLRESNEAAQEWMSKAVEHHNMLSHQLADLANENKNLKSKVKDLAAKALTTSSASKLIEELQRDLKDRTEQLSSASSQLSAKEQEIQGLLNTHAVESKTISEQLSQTQAEVEMLRAGLKAEEAKIHKLAEHSEGAGLLEEELRAKVDELEQAVRTKEYEIEETKVQVAAMDMEVAELKADLALETEEKEDLVRQVETLKKNLQLEAEKLVKDRESSDAVRLQIVELESALAAARGGLEADEKVVHQWEGTHACVAWRCAMYHYGMSFLFNPFALYSAVDRVNELEDTVKCLEDQLESQKREASDAIAQWESRCENLQSNAVETSDSDHDQADRIAELEALLKHRDEQLEHADEDSRKVVSQWEEGYIRLEKELEEVQEQLHEAEKAKEEAMREKDGDAIAQVSQVEDESKAESTPNQAELQHQAEIDRLTAALIELRVELDAANEKRLKLEEEHEAALNQLEVSEREADDVVSEWEQSYNDIQQQFKELQEDFRVVTQEKDSALVRAQEKLLEIEDLQQRLREQKEAATGEFRSIQEQLENDIASRDMTIGELQQQLNERGERLSELEKALSERESAAADAITSATSYESDVEGLSERIETVSKERDALQDQLAQVELDANTVVQQWKERAEAFEEQLVLRQNELTTSNDEKEAALARECELSLRAEDLSQQLETLTVDRATLTQRLEQVERDANDVVQQWKDRSDSFEQQLKQLENELLVSNEEKESALAREKETFSRVADLEGRIDTLQSNASQEHAVKCQQYEKTIDNLGRTNDELKVQVEEHDGKMLALEQELEKTRATADENLRNANAQSVRVDELEQQVECLKQENASLETQMEETGREANDVIFQWQESYNGLQAEVNGLKEEMTQAKNELRLALEAKDDVAVHEREKSVMAAELEEQLRIQQEHAAKELSSEREKHEGALSARDTTINELQSQLNETSDKLTALEQTVEEARVALAESVENGTALQLEIDRLQEHVQRLTAEKEILENQIEESGRETDDVVFQWEESYNALQEQLVQARNDLRLAAEANEDVTVHEQEKSVQVTQLEERLRHEQGKAAAELSAEREKFDAAIAARDMTIGELQSQLQDYSDQLSSRERAMQDNGADLEKSLEKVAALEREAESFQQQIDTLAAEKDELEALLEAEQRDAEDVISQWESSHAAVQSQLEQAQDELRVASVDNEKIGARVTEMQSQMADLNEQLAQAQDELQQSSRPDEVSMREQEIAKEFERLETQLAAAKEELSVIRAEKEAYLKREEEQLAHIEELRDETRLQQTESEEVLADLKQREAAITERDHTITDLQLQLTDLGTEILELRHAAEEQQSKHAAVVDELEKRAAFGEMEAVNLSQEIDLLVKERSALQQQLNAATANVQSSVFEWETDCKEAQEQLRLVQEELDVATSEKDEAETRVEQLMTQIEDLKESLSVQESSAAEAISAERRDHEEAIASLYFSLAELRAKVAEQAEEHSALERESKERQEEELCLVDELRKTADAQKLEIESLRQRIDGLVHERDELVKHTAVRTSKAMEENQEHPSGENLLQDQINTLRSENDDLNGKIALLEANLRAESQRRSTIDAERDVAQRELENVRIESEETINLWTGKLKPQEATQGNVFFISRFLLFYRASGGAGCHDS
jgi:chromosome segregation ATPase